MVLRLRGVGWQRNGPQKIRADYQRGFTMTRELRAAVCDKGSSVNSRSGLGGEKGSVSEPLSLNSGTLPRLAKSNGKDSEDSDQVRYAQPRSLKINRNIARATLPLLFGQRGNVRPTPPSVKVATQMPSFANGRV